MKNITDLLILHPDMRIGGAERQIVNLIKGLGESGFYRVVVALYEIEGPLISEILDLPNVEIIEVGKFSKRPVWVLRQLRKIIKREQTDVLYTFLVGPNIAGSVLRWIAPLYKFVWGNRVSKFEEREFGIKGVVANYFARFCIKSADLVISNSYAGLRDLVDARIHAKRKIVIHNGIDTTIYFQSEERRVKARELMGLESQAIVIGIIGRLVEWKGADIFLKAGGELIVRHPDVKFVVVGDGDPNWKESLVRAAGENGLEDNISWMGSRLDVEILLNGIDILTVCSTSGEGFPNIIGEAMASGTAVVASDVGDNRIILDDNELLVPVNDIWSLMRAWSALVENREYRNSVGEKGIRLVKKHYTIDGMVQNTDKVLRET